MLQMVAVLKQQFRSLPLTAHLLRHGVPPAWVMANLSPQGGVYVDSSDNVSVSDFGENNRIQKFDSNGNFLSKWGTTGSGDGQFIRPANLALDASGNIFVVDEGNNRIQKFDNNAKV